jgi:hypothetical protein
MVVHSESVKPSRRGNCGPQEAIALSLAVFGKTAYLKAIGHPPTCVFSWAGSSSFAFAAAEN